MFAAGDDGILEFITRGPAPRHLAPVYGQAPYLSANPSTFGRGVVRIESLCRAILSLRQDIPGMLDQDFLIIRNNS
jgi:hypothetical protein